MQESTLFRPVSGPIMQVRAALALAAARADDALPLAALSAHAGLSPFRLHRLFRAVAGETPKQYTLRLRIGGGAARLLTSRRSVHSVAMSCGFWSHEAFTRAFVRQFGMSPRAYRARGFAAPVGPAAGAVHAAVVRRVGPCVRLFRAAPEGPAQRSDMSYSIVRKALPPQPVLIVRRRVPRSGIANAIGEALPPIFQYAQQHGIPLAGHPFTRYVEVGAGLMTIEPGMRVVGSRQATAAPSAAAAAATSGDSVIEDALPGGTVASTVHAGTYETLGEAYGALEQWIESQAVAKAGPPWESYITDPAEHPDPKDWKTEICWPIG